MSKLDIEEKISLFREIALSKEQNETYEKREEEILKFKEKEKIDSKLKEFTEDYKLKILVTIVLVVYVSVFGGLSFMLRDPEWKIISNFFFAMAFLFTVFIILVFYFFRKRRQEFVILQKKSLSNKNDLPPYITHCFFDMSF